MNKNIIRRLVVYFCGLFLMTIGISLSVKSNLGVSPVSSIPYTITCVWGLEMGKATILFHCFLVLIQIILLRKKFNSKNLLQVVIGIIFGYFTTLCNWIVSFWYIPDNLWIRIGLILISTVFVAFGIFLYMPANIMPLAGEGVMQAVSDVTKIAFPKVKVGFDVSMVVISLITCQFYLHNFGSVGIGTIIAALLVGTILGGISKQFGKQRDKFLGKSEEIRKESRKNNRRYVITIAREYGSGGREIGKQLAQRLKIPYYDLEIIRKVAQENNLAEKVVSQKEQSLKNIPAQMLYHWCVQPSSNSELPIAEQIFQTQKKVIEEYANNQSCVIVGRLSNFILKDYNGIKIFIGADIDAKIKRVMQREKISEAEARCKIRKVESERDHHCYYFTHKKWKNTSNYDFYIKSNLLGIDQTVSLIEKIVNDKLENLKK